MRILIDICVFDLRNKGNIAMLQSAVGRLRKFWPDASMEVLTVGPLLLKYYLPECIPVNPYGQPDSLSWGILQKNFQFIPASIWRLIFIMRDRIQQYQATRAARKFNPEFGVEMNWTNSTSKADSTKIVNARESLSNASNAINMDFLSGIDLFVAAGGHYLSDPCKDSAIQSLERMAQAIQRGIPTVLVGQGMGPFEDLELLKKTKDILPKVDLILVREKRFAPHFLESIGVLKDRIILTGDDAIEMSYQARVDSKGSGIGIGLRVAASSEVNIEHILKVKPVLDLVTVKYQSKFVPLPISDSVYELVTDEQVIRKLLSGHLNNWHEKPYLFPIDIINLVSKCRIVVTGAYHPAVFALAQGIPVICLAKSSHYSNKLSGLADIFEKGCEIIMLDDENIKEKLSNAIDYAWAHAEELRSSLLESARSQVKWANAGYRRIFELVASRN